jgi:hypothetical protein
MKPKFKTTTMTTTFTLAHLPKRHCICRRLATCHTHHKTQAVVVAVEALGSVPLARQTSTGTGDTTPVRSLSS